MSYRGASRRWRLAGYERELIERAEKARIERRRARAETMFVHDARHREDDIEPGRGRAAIRHSPPVRGSVLSVR